MSFAFRGAHTPAAWETWHQWGGDNYEVTDNGVVLARGLTPTYVEPERITTGLPEAVGTADVALDECGTLYVLTEAGNVYRDDRDDGVLEPVSWHLFADDAGGDGDGDGADDARPSPTNLCLTRSTMYVIDGKGRLHGVSRHRWTTRWVLDSLVDPVAVVADDRRAYVLDARADANVVLAVDAEGDTATVVSVSDLTAPRDVALDAEDNLYILATKNDDPPGPVVQRFDRDVEATSGYIRASTFVRVPAHFDPVCIAVVSVDEVVVGVGEAAVGRQTLVRYLPEHGTFERVSTFEGACTTLLLRRRAHGRSTGLYVVDPAGVVTFLVEARTNRLSTRTDRYDARVVRRFDSGEPDVEWHRVTIDFTLAGPGTQVRLLYAATDDDIGVDDVEWQPLGRPNPDDALLTGARGRYLWVTLEVVGTESASPTLNAFRAYFPRSSYLRHLPAVYQQDETSAAFLERFLSIFESIYLGIEAEIESLPRFLDAQGVDPAFLGWLESWLALTPDETWTNDARRDLLKRAPELYTKRGTRTGLLALLELFLDNVDRPVVSWERAHERERETIEQLVADGHLTEAKGVELLAAHESLADKPTTDLFYLIEEGNLDCIDEPEVRALYRRLVPCPQCFVVLLAPYVDQERRRTVERIVETERPAHAVGRTVGLQPWVELGRHAYLGVNSTLPTRESVVERSGLGRDSVLVGHETRRATLDKDGDILI